VQFVFPKTTVALIVSMKQVNKRNNLSSGQFTVIKAPNGQFAQLCCNLLPIKFHLGEDQFFMGFIFLSANMS
jgi:hypothetical protein